MNIPVQLHQSSILHIWLKTRTPSQTRPAQIRLQNREGEFVIAESRQYIEFEFVELSPRIEDGQAQLEWITGGNWKNYYLSDENTS